MNIIKHFANQLQWIPLQLLESELFNIPDIYNKIELRRLRTGNLLGYYLAPDTSIYFDVYPTIRSESLIDLMTRYNIPFDSNDRILDEILTSTDYIQVNLTKLIESGFNITLALDNPTTFEIIIGQEQLDEIERDSSLMWQQAIEFFYRNGSGASIDVLVEDNIFSMGVDYSVNYDAIGGDYEGSFINHTLYFYGYASPTGNAPVDVSKTVRHTVRYLPETSSWESVSVEYINILGATAPSIGEYIYTPDSNVLPSEIEYLYKENTDSSVDFNYSMNFYVSRELTPTGDPFLLIPPEPNLEPGQE